MTRLYRRFSTIAICLAIIFLCGRIATRAPLQDEAYYGLPARHAVESGHWGLPQLDPTGFILVAVKERVPELQTKSYWAISSWMLSLRGWFRMVGFGLLRARLLAAIASLAFLLAWSHLIYRASGKRVYAILACLFVGTHWMFASFGAVARPEPFSAMWGALALACYMGGAAPVVRAFLSGGCLALCASAHPNGGAIWSIAFVLVYLLFPENRIRPTWTRAAAFFAPFVVLAAVAYWIYAQDPATFRSQLWTNTVVRSQAGASIAVILKRELIERYGFGSTMKFLTLAIVPWSSILWFLFRRRPVFLWRFAAIAAALSVFLTFFDGLKFVAYYFHLLPWCLTVVALAAYVLVGKRRYFLAACLGVTVLVNIAALSVAAWRNDLDNQYRPMVKALESFTAAGGDVAGPVLLAFGYNGAFTDDVRLGFRSGKRYRWIVIDDISYRDEHDLARRFDPAVYTHVQEIERTCPVRFGNRLYLIFECPAAR